MINQLTHYRRSVHSGQRIMKRHRPLLGYFGHHKAGSSWILNVNGAICSEIGLRFGHFHSPKMFNFDLLKTVKEQRFDFVSYSNADINFVRPILEGVRGFHVIRDPRDIVVSAYFSHLYSHSDRYWPERSNYRSQLEKLPKDKGLLLTMDYLTSIMVEGETIDILGNICMWDYSLPNILEVKFEELIVNPYGMWLEILRFLGVLDNENVGLRTFSVYILRRILSLMARRMGFSMNHGLLIHGIHPWRALSIVYENDFSALAGGRNAGEEDVRHHYRKGVTGDWKNHFREEHKRFFKERYGAVLIKLGYERDENW